MPKLTKPFWAEWQDNPQRELASRTTTRMQAASAPPGRIDPSKTVIDQIVTVPVRGPKVEDGWAIERTTTQRRVPAPQEAEPVNHGEDQRSQSQGDTALARRADSAMSRQPPAITVANHNFGAELATDERLILLREPDSDRAAMFRVLRHQVVRQGDPQVIVVSSALPEEGKTTTAVNLALALAECGRARVLLAEVNFVRPCLSQIFRFTPPWCFAQQIFDHRTDAERRWSVVEVPPHGLHIAAVDLRTERRQMLDAPAFAFAIEQMRMAGYDYIVLDAPSVLGSGEVNMLQDSADGVLLVVRGDSSHRKELRGAIEQLAPETILGVALLS